MAIENIAAVADGSAELYFYRTSGGAEVGLVCRRNPSSDLPLAAPATAIAKALAPHGQLVI